MSLLNLEKAIITNPMAIFVGKAISLSNKKAEWILDLGASYLMTCERDAKTNERSFTFDSSVKISNGSFVSANSYRDVISNPIVKVSNVLYIPSFACNLISISKLTKTLNCATHFFSFLLCSTGPSHEEADWPG